MAKTTSKLGHYTKKKRAKNVFSLKDFGHGPSLKTLSNFGDWTGQLLSDRRQADSKIIPLENEQIEGTPTGQPEHNDHDDGQDLPEEARPGPTPGKRKHKCK
ncbi:hypothetical protein K438DRAFT_1746896 [Mycena galopus ATCC 62051]|nr:hypothetical protein K438DRAFT_1746896 [Mycena galopus ATCC 62051]